MPIKISGKELGEQNQAHLTAMDYIVNRAKAEKRDLTEQENELCESLNYAVSVNTKRIRDDKLSRGVDDDDGTSLMALMAGHQPTTRRGKGFCFHTAEGNRVYGLLRNEAVQAERPQVSVGEYLHAMLTNDYGRLPSEFLNQQTVSSDSGGGYLLTPALSSQVVDLARSASVAIRAGSQTLPMDTSELNIARVTGDPTAQWRAETVKVNSSSVTFDKIVLRPKTVAAIIPVSIELLEDTANAAEVIENTLQAALGLALDQAVLKGSGASAEPKGVRNHGDVNTITSVGTPANYNDISNAIGDIYAANYQGIIEDLAWISHPRDDDTYDQLADTTNQPLLPTPRVAKVQRFSTTSIDTDEGGGTNESWSLVGHFPQCVIGMRTSGVNIRIADDGSVTDASGTTWNATNQLMRLVVAYLRADVALLRPTWFTVLSGITNT